MPNPLKGWGRLHGGNVVALHLVDQARANRGARIPRYVREEKPVRVRSGHPARTNQGSEPPMADTDKAFAGSIPKLHETCLVPLIFQPYAMDIRQRIGSLGVSRILEVAAGTGVVTRALATLENVSIVATDLNQAMLDEEQRWGPHVLLGGGRQTPWRFPSLTANSMPPYASWAPCSFLTKPGRSPRYAGCSSRKVSSFSTSGTASRRTNSPTAYRPRSKWFFRKIRHVSLSGHPMVATIKLRSGKISPTADSENHHG